MCALSATEMYTVYSSAERSDCSPPRGLTNTWLLTAGMTGMTAYCERNWCDGGKVDRTELVTQAGNWYM
jgi:hypothetical protein